MRERVGEVTELFGLSDILSRPYGKLSGGQRRRADVARGLIHRPSILFLDEPTTGLDPQTRRRVWDVLHTLRKETGMTLFLTTHYMRKRRTRTPWSSWTTASSSLAALRMSSKPFTPATM